MTSLAEAYERNEREVTSPRRRYAGTALVLSGAALAVLALLVVTTDLFSFLASGTRSSRELAGTLGGFAVPTVLVGVFMVLPAGRRAQATAALSASLCLLGVALFRYAYPHHWDGLGRDLTLFVSTVYLIGLFSAIWCLFVVVANFKMRNDPGGALEMTVTRQGKTKVVEVDRGTSGVSGIGFLGSTPDGEVETQTNQGGPAGTDRVAATTGASSAATRGQHTTDDGRTTHREPADHYCGNCRHFEYQRESTGMVPYCRRHGERMEDMDPCQEWAPNR